jgi:acetyl-CoA acetyltransferase
MGRVDVEAGEAWVVCVEAVEKMKMKMKKLKESESSSSTCVCCLNHQQKSCRVA